MQNSKLYLRKRSGWTAGSCWCETTKEVSILSSGLTQGCPALRLHHQLAVGNSSAMRQWGHSRLQITTSTKQRSCLLFWRTSVKSLFHLQFPFIKLIFTPYSTTTERYKLPEQLIEHVAVKGLYYQMGRVLQHHRRQAEEWQGEASRHEYVLPLQIRRAYGFVTGKVLNTREEVVWILVGHLADA